MMTGIDSPFWCGGRRLDGAGNEQPCMHHDTLLASKCPNANGPRRVKAEGSMHTRHEPPAADWRAAVDKLMKEGYAREPINIAPGDPIAALVAVRGETYGPPATDFARMGKFWDIVAECPDPMARHALLMICVKISRLIKSPTHRDSWIDIQGYGRCGAEVMARDE